MPSTSGAQVNNEEVILLGQDTFKFPTQGLYLRSIQAAAKQRILNALAVSANRFIHLAPAPFVAEIIAYKIPVTG
jgi:hypothetical protein